MCLFTFTLDKAPNLPNSMSPRECVTQLLHVSDLSQLFVTYSGRSMYTAFRMCVCVCVQEPCE